MCLSCLALWGHTSIRPAVTNLRRNNCAPVGFKKEYVQRARVISDDVVIFRTAAFKIRVTYIDPIRIKSGPKEGGTSQE